MPHGPALLFPHPALIDPPLRPRRRTAGDARDKEIEPSPPSQDTPASHAHFRTRRWRLCDIAALMLRMVESGITHMWELYLRRSGAVVRLSGAWPYAPVAVLGASGQQKKT